MPLLAVEISDERVALLRIVEELPDRRIGLAWHRDRARSSAARSFLESTQRICDGILVMVPA